MFSHVNEAFAALVRWPPPRTRGQCPGCVTELGCIFIVSLPAPDLTLTAAIDWLPVTYTVSSEFLGGSRGSAPYARRRIR
jgi:hypothetical protein